MEYWKNYNLKYLGKTLLRCYFVYHKSHMDWTGAETRISAVFVHDKNTEAVNDVRMDEALESTEALE
jgi:hypothetical protein